RDARRVAVSRELGQVGRRRDVDAHARTVIAPVERSLSSSEPPAPRTRRACENRGMTDPRLAVVVLAAGQGTRMKSARPKVLHELAGVPLLGHVLATARELAAAHVVTVVRHEREQVAAAVAELLPEAIV